MDQAENELPEVPQVRIITIEMITYDDGQVQPDVNLGDFDVAAAITLLEQAADSLRQFVQPAILTIGGKRHEPIEVTFSADDPEE